MHDAMPMRKVLCTLSGMYMSSSQRITFEATTSPSNFICIVHSVGASYTTVYSENGIHITVNILVVCSSCNADETYSPWNLRVERSRSVKTIALMKYKRGALDAEFHYFGYCVSDGSIYIDCVSSSTVLHIRYP